MPTCRELVELVTDYLDGALPPERHAEVVAHLEGCADCQRYLAQLQTTRRVLATVRSATLSPDERSAVVDAFRDWCSTARTPLAADRPWWRRRRRATGAR